MGVQFLKPTGAEEFNLGAGIGASGVDLYEQQKARRLQLAVEAARLQQQGSEYQQTQSRLQTQDQALNDYRQQSLKQTAAHQKTMEDTAAQGDKFKQEQAAQHQQNWEADYNRRVANDESLDEFRQRAKQFQTDPQTHALEQQHKLIGDEWQNVAKALKSVTDPGLGGPLEGHEKEYGDYTTRLQKLDADRVKVGDVLKRRYAAVAGGNNPDAAPGGAGAPPTQSGAPRDQPSGNPHVEDLNVPLPAGVRPFNPGAQAPAKPDLNAIMQGLQQLPAALGGKGPAPAPTPQQAATAQVPAEQTRQWVNQYAYEAGVKPQDIHGRPPMTASQATRLKAKVATRFSDPVRQYQEFYRAAILSGFDPTVPAVPDAQGDPMTRFNLGGF